MKSSLKTTMAVLAVFAVATSAFCDGDKDASRRREFAEAMVKAMRNFEDLYNPQIQITVVEPRKGEATVEVKGKDSEATARLESALGITIANFALKYPGIRFMALEDGTWRVLIPQNIKLPNEGDFGLDFP